MNRSLPLLALAVLALAAIGARAQDQAPRVVVDRAKRTVTIDARVAPRKINDPQFMGKVYPIEVIACWPFPRGRKAHETVLTIEAKPGDVHKALESLGLKAGKPVVGDVKEKVQGPLLKIYVEIPGEAGPRRVPIERTVIDPRSGKPMPKVRWHFTGSIRSKPKPDQEETAYGADLSGTLIALFPVTNETVVQSSLTMKEEKYLKLETNTKVLPKEGTPVKLILEAASK